jgi:hypothetical protein
MLGSLEFRLRQNSTDVESPNAQTQLCKATQDVSAMPKLQATQRS